MATIANLAVSLTAKVGDFEKGFARAQKVAGRFASDVAGHVRTITGYGAAITGVAAGALAYMVREQLRVIDSTTKMANQIGVATEQLIGLRYAAGQAGAENEKLDKGLINLTRKVSEAAGGMGEAKDVLKELRLDAAMLAAMSPDQQFLAVSDALAGVANQSDRVRIAVKLFEEGGVDLINLMQQGSGAIRDTIAEAERLGITFNSIEGAGVERANGAMSRLQQAITGVVTRITVQLAPYIEVVSNRLLAFAQQGNISGEVVVNAMEQIVLSMAKVGRALDLISIGTNAFEAGVKFLAGSVTELLRVPLHWVDVLLRKLGVDVLEDANKFMETMGGAFFDSMQKDIESIGNAWDSLLSGDTERKIKTFFQGIKAEAEQAAGAAASLSVPDLQTQSLASTKTAEFRQVDLDRVAIGGPTSIKEKPINKAQGDKLIQGIMEIARNTRTGQAIIV